MMRIAFFLALVASLAAAEPAADLRLDLAKKWEQSGQLDRAAQELRLHLSEYPDDVAAYEWLGDLRLRMGQSNGALESYRAALRRDPARPALQAKLAVALEKSGDKNGALDAWRKLSNTAAQKNWVDTAKQNLKRIARGEPLPAEPPPAPQAAHAPADSGAHPSKPRTASPTPAPTTAKPAAGIYAMPEFNAAIQQYRAGHKDEALKTLRVVLRKAPGHPGAYYLGGVIRYERGELDKAIYDFKRSTAYPDKGFNAYFYLGRIYQKQGRNREAIAAYESYVKATQSDAGRKQAEDAIQALRAHLSPVPAKTKPPTTLPDTTAPSKPAAVEAAESQGEAAAYPIGGGILYVISASPGPGAQALEAAREALEDNRIERCVQGLKAVQVQFAGSANAEAVPVDLAAVYLKLGLYQQAGAQADDYLAHHAGGRFERYARYLSALALTGQGQGEQAVPLLQKVDRDSGFGPPRPEVIYHLARASEGDPKDQATYLLQAEKGIQDASRLLWIRQKLGAFWAKQGEDGKAAEYYRKSLAACVDTSLAEACLESTVQLGDLEFRRHAWPAAMAAYGDLLRKYPQAKEAAWAQYQMANISKAQGDWDAALQAYQRVIDNYPDSYWAAQAKWQKDDAVWRKEYQGVLH